MTQSSFRDVEQISALLDGKLAPADVARLEQRLASDPDLRAVYEDLRQARALLRRLPQRRAPRNFTLKPAASRVRPPLPRAFPLFRLASVLTSILFMFSMLTNAAIPRLAMMANNTQPMYAYGRGGGMEIEDRPMGGGGSDVEAAPEAAAAPKEPEPVLEAPAPAVEQVQPDAPAAEDPGLTIQSAPVEELAPLPSPEPEPVQPPLPGWLLVSLAVVAALSGAVAFFLRWRTDARWKASQKT